MKKKLLVQVCATLVVVGVLAYVNKKRVQKEEKEVREAMEKMNNVIYPDIEKWKKDMVDSSGINQAEPASDIDKDVDELEKVIERLEREKNDPENRSDEERWRRLVMTANRMTSY